VRRLADICFTAESRPVAPHSNAVVTVATVWIIWQVLEKIEPDEVTDIRTFLTFIIVVVPFVTLICGGLAILIHDGMMAASVGLRSLPLVSFSREIFAGAVIYIGLTVWLWSHWRKLAAVPI
jgi:hypothetical protein